MTRAAILTLGLIVLASAFEAWRRWSARRRLSRARFTPSVPEVQPGGTLSGVLESDARLAQAREVRFDLVEAGGSAGRRVRETVVVSFTAFQVVEGVARVPVALPMPADARRPAPSSALVTIVTLLLFHEVSSNDAKWELHATAEVEGVPFRARFRVRLLAPDVVPTPAGPPRPPGHFPVPPPPVRARSKTV